MTDAKAYAKEYADGLNSAMDTAYKAADATLQGNIDTLSGRVDTNKTALDGKVDAGTVSDGLFPSLAVGKDSVASYDEYFGGSTAIGGSSKAGSLDTAIGYRAQAIGYNSVAIGCDSVASESLTVSVGNSDTGIIRKIVNVADGDIASANSHDAVTGGQLYATNQNVATNTSSITTINQSITAMDEAYKSADTELKNLIESKTTGLATDYSLGEVQDKTQNIDKDKTGSGKTYFNGDVEVGGNGKFIGAVNASSFNGVKLNIDNSETSLLVGGELGIGSVAGNSTIVGIYNELVTDDVYDATVVGYYAVANSYSTAVGSVVSASGESSTAIGYSASATAKNSVALGANSSATEENTVSVGNVGSERLSM